MTLSQTGTLNSAWWPVQEREVTLDGFWLLWGIWIQVGLQLGLDCVCGLALRYGDGSHGGRKRE